MTDVPSGRAGSCRRGVVAVVVSVVLMAAAGAVAGWFADRPLFESQGMIKFRPDSGGEPIALYDDFVQSNISLLTNERVLSSAAESDEFRRVVGPAGTGPDLRQLIADFRDHVDVRRSPGATVVLVRYTAADPDAARAGVGAVIRSFLEHYGDMPQRDLQPRLALQEQVITSLTRELRSMQDKLLELTREYGTDDLRDVYRMRLKEMMDLSGRLNAAKVDLVIRESATTRPADDGRGGVTETLRANVTVLTQQMEAAQKEVQAIGLVRRQVPELNENIRYTRQRLRKANEERDRLNMQLALAAPIQVESFGDAPVQVAGVRTGTVVGAAVGGALPLSLAPLILFRKRKDRGDAAGGTGAGAAGA